MHKSPLVALGFWSIPQENWHWEGPENIVLVTQNAAISTVHFTFASCQILLVWLVKVSDEGTGGPEHSQGGRSPKTSYLKGYQIFYLVNMNIKFYKIL